MSSTWASRSISTTATMATGTTAVLPLSNIVYQSEPARPPSELELELLISEAQSRNLEEGVTGLLIYDQGHFLQWLEGPAESVGRIWNAIRQDRRHKRICLLGQSHTAVRLFGDSPMGLAMRRSRGKQQNELELSDALIESVYTRLSALPFAKNAVAPDLPVPLPINALLPSRLKRADRLALAALCEEAIIPELIARHAALVLAAPVIDPRSGDLARLLVAAEPTAAFALIDSLRADGRSVARLCAGLLEPTARALFDLWKSDDCDELEVAMALRHLQSALRRASLEVPSIEIPVLAESAPHTVLVAPSPNEPHMLGSVIASEMFWRAGWTVSCEFPTTDAALSALVHDHWFDVLELSLSSTFPREHRLAALAESISAAHASSLNPGLVVIVDGRVFHDRPKAFAEVGADASNASAMDIVATAEAHTQGTSKPG